MKLGEMLLEAGLVTEAQIEAALGRERLRLGSALIADRAVDPEAVARTLAQQHGLPALRLSDLERPDPAARALVPDSLARRACAVGLAIRGSGVSRVLTVAMRDPSDLVAIDELTFAASMKIDPRVAPELLLLEAIDPHEAADAAAARSSTTQPAPAGLGRPPSGERRALDVDRPPSGERRALDLDRPPSGVRRALDVDRPPSGERRALDPAGDGGDLELAIDPREAATRRRPPPTLRPAHAAVSLPSATDYQSSGGGNLVSSLLKLGVVAALIIGGVYFAKSYKKCFTSSAKSVGTHYDSKELGLSIDFPESKWRTLPGAGKKVGPRAEYFFRGSAPELPVVGMYIVRGPAEEIAGAAQTLMEEVVRDVQGLGCKPSYARAGAYMCGGYGTVGLFGQRMQNAEVEVHAWKMGTDIVAAVMIKPDHTLSETEYILGSIVEYVP